MCASRHYERYLVLVDVHNAIGGLQNVNYNNDGACGSKRLHSINPLSIFKNKFLTVAKSKSVIGRTFDTF